MPEGIGYGAIKKKKPQKRNRLRKLSPKEIEKEFQGKHKIENPPAKHKISKLTRKKLSRDIQTHAQIDDDIKKYGGATVALTLNSTLKAAKKRADDHERNLKESLIQSKRAKFIRKTKEDDAKKSKATKEKLKAERKKGNPDISKRTRK